VRRWLVIAASSGVSATAALDRISRPCRTVDGAVRLYRVNGGGHQVPTFAPDDPEWIKKAGRRNHDIETAEEFWSFARKFSR
jgi:hypothetical protein